VVRRQVISRRKTRDPSPDDCDFLPQGAWLIEHIFLVFFSLFEMLRREEDNGSQTTEFFEIYTFTKMRNDTLKMNDPDARLARIK